MNPILRVLRMATELSDRRYWMVIFLAIVDFCCVLLALERYDKGDIRVGTYWLIVGIALSLLGWKWPQIRTKIGKQFAASGQYRQILAVAALILLTAYDIYDRHVNGWFVLAPWWHHGPILLGVVAVIWLMVGGLRRKEPSKLVIHSANYRAWKEGGKTFDVAEFLRKIIGEDSLVLGPIENHSFVVDGKNYVPTDPYPYESKRLEVTYSYDGEQSRTVMRDEHWRMVLPEDSKIQQLERELGTVRDAERSAVNRQHNLQRALGEAQAKYNEDIARCRAELETLKRNPKSTESQQIHLQSSVDWNKEWMEMEDDFRRKENALVFAECGRDSEGKEVWSIKAEILNFDPHEYVILCALAGSKLIASIPHIELSSEVSSEREAWIRWLKFMRAKRSGLHKNAGYTQDQSYGYTDRITRKPVSHPGGLIQNLPKEAAEICVVCRATTYA